MASLYLASGDDITISNNNIQVYGVGGAGTETIRFSSGLTGIVVDQNIEAVRLTGNSTDYVYQQQGINLVVYSGSNVVATIPLQADTDGTVLTFANATVPVTIVPPAGAAVTPTLSFNGTPVVAGTTAATATALPTTPTGGGGTATVAITAAASLTDGGASINTAYNISAGTYNANIAGFGAGDKLGFFSGAAITVVSDASDTDGIQVIQASDAATGGTMTITLTGLTNVQDAGLFNQGSINTVFGANTVSTTGAVTTTPPTPTATYTITPGTTVVGEGVAQVFTLATTNVANGTVLTYAITGTGITTADTTVPLTGTVTVNTNAATLTLTPTNDLTTEGTETATITFSLASVQVGNTSTLTITDTSLGATQTNVTQAITGAAALTDGGASVNTTYNISAGTYTASIAGFGAGDKLGFFSGAAITVLSDTSDTDGIQQIQASDAATGGTMIITLTGLTNAQDAGLFNQGSFNTVFGAGTLV